MTFADTPVARAPDGRPIYDNTATVVSMLVTINNRLLVVRRGNNPGKGKLGLPGGYHMHGESWQQAGVREVWEETGYKVDSAQLMQVGETVTDEYGNNLIIARAFKVIEHNRHWAKPDEVEEVLLLNEVGFEEQWAFPKHFKAARKVVPNSDDELRR